MYQRCSVKSTAPAVARIERPAPEELSVLFDALSWGRPSIDALAASIKSYTATVCARTPPGLLVGYASVFSDRVLTTMFGEFVVHPKFQRRGIGSAMMRAVESKFPSAPIYVKALGASVAFYTALGFCESSTTVTSMFRRPGKRSHRG
jgi:GNAT superfamily N-acetyltransferase